MGLPAKRGGTTPIAKKQRLQRGSQVLLDASTALRTIAESLDEDFLVAVDRILDMARTIVNVSGDAVACVVVAGSEGRLLKPGQIADGGDAD